MRGDRQIRGPISTLNPAVWAKREEGAIVRTSTQANFPSNKEIAQRDHMTTRLTWFFFLIRGPLSLSDIFRSTTLDPFPLTPTIL